MTKSKVILPFLAIVVFAIYSFTRRTSSSASVPVKLSESLLNNGDIIFRDGRGAISILFRNMSLTDNSYSHAGIIHKEGSETFVYHLLGGEGNEALMRKEKLSKFCSQNEAYSIGVYRSNLDGEKIDLIAGNYFTRKIKFDNKFDLSTDDKMYCTELVYKILKEVSAEDNFLPLTTVRNITYCSCDNIFLSSHLNKITGFNY